MLYSCTHMATVSGKGLTRFEFDVMHIRSTEVPEWNGLKVQCDDWNNITNSRYCMYSGAEAVAMAACAGWCKTGAADSTAGWLPCFSFFCCDCMIAACATSAAFDESAATDTTIHENQLHPSGIIQQPIFCISGCIQNNESGFPWPSTTFSCAFSRSRVDPCLTSHSTWFRS